MKLTFRWDKDKARKNYRKHKVTFDSAKGVFEDAFALELIDDRRAYGEERLVIIGMVDERILYVAFAERDDVVRLISARRATRHEAEAYYQQASFGTSASDTKRH